MPKTFAPSERKEGRPTTDIHEPYQPGALSASRGEASPEAFMRERGGIVRRRMLASLVLGVGLTLIGPGVALAEAPHHVMLPDAACNQGTFAARVISGNGIVPMWMDANPRGCMTMPGAFQP